MLLFTPILITPDTHNLSPSLDARLRTAGHSRFTALGNLAILEEPLLALFCSVKCTGRLILQTYDLAAALRDLAIPTIGGFHTPMERECLSVLLRGSQPIVVCPARSIDNFRVPTEWKAPLAGGRLLILSPFSSNDHRPTRRLALARNAFVAALAVRVFVAYADPGGATERLGRAVLAAGKPLLTFDAPENAALLALGAKPVVREALEIQ